MFIKEKIKTLKKNYKYTKYVAILQKNNFNNEKDGYHSSSYIAIKQYLPAIGPLLCFAFYILWISSLSRDFVFEPNITISQKNAYIYLLDRPEKLALWLKNKAMVVTTETIQMDGAITFSHGRYVYMSKDDLKSYSITPLSSDEIILYSDIRFTPTHLALGHFKEAHLITANRVLNSVKHDIRIENNRLVTLGGAVVLVSDNKFTYISKDELEHKYLIEHIAKKN